jgi:Protein of unknown function (DUF1566)
MLFNKNYVLSRSCGAIVMLLCVSCIGQESYPVVDTGVKDYFDNTKQIKKPRRGKPFYGQDAQYRGQKPAYRNNRNGTVSDLVTGLMWQKNPGAKKTLSEARKEIKNFALGGHKDWRIPTIKELYSLIIFTGIDPSMGGISSKKVKPFINTKYFSFDYGDSKKGERIIDSQFGTSTIYNTTTMWGNPTMFGVNFADGRIKGYPYRFQNSGREKTFFFIYVRGNPDYGKNKFVDNGDGTITDEATGLMWMQVDSGYLKAGDWKQGGLNWQQALAWSENLKYAGYSDWRLPNVKELQSLVDYSRSPKTTQSPAINPLFKLSSLIDEGGCKNYPFYWTGTTHLNQRNATAADYIAFGDALGWLKGWNGQYYLLDVHGAGAQRSDPKSGNPKNYPYGRGPQGDVIRIYNFVIAVRAAKK